MELSFITIFGQSNNKNMSKALLGQLSFDVRDNRTVSLAYIYLCLVRLQQPQLLLEILEVHHSLGFCLPAHYA